MSLDMSLCFEVSTAGLLGLICVYVAVSLNCGNRDVLKETHKTLERSQSKGREFENNEFAIVNLETTPDRIIIHQGPSKAPIK